MSPTDTVRILMRAPVLTVTGDTPIADASQMLTKERIGSLVVVSEDDGSVTGILSERDVVEATSHRASSLANVAEWMTPDPVTVESDAAPSSALETMVTHGFRHLPVVDSGRLVGMVSARDLMAVAQLQHVRHPGELEAPKGLAGVIVAETAVGDVRGHEGFFHYQQYSAVDLAEHRSLEDVWFLLVHERLPSAVELARFRSEVAGLRAIPPATAALLPGLARAAHEPVDALRTAVSLVGSELGLRPWLDAPLEELRAQTLRLCAVVPTLVMALHHLGRGEDPVAPDPELAYAANYLWMLTGEAPDPAHARAIEQYLIATIDHGFNASTFTARVITSTGADLVAAVTGAIGALSGPLHGGAPSRALGLLDDIGDPSRAEEVVERLIESGERIMGFGHRVYKTRDPRSELLRRAALRLGGDRAELAEAVEQTVVDVLARLKPNRELYANVEYYAGVVFEQVGLPPELFTPTFVSSRMLGWCAHVIEQAADNRLIRPTARYVGPPAPAELLPI